jgi:hypothetical protein
VLDVVSDEDDPLQLVPPRLTRSTLTSSSESLALSLRSMNQDCLVETVRFASNTLPVVAMLDRVGEPLGVLQTGDWPARFWDEPHPGTASSPWREDARQPGASDDHPMELQGLPAVALESVRIVHVRNGTASPAGELCDGSRCFTDPRSFAGAPRTHAGLPAKPNLLLSQLTRNEKCSSIVQLDGPLVVLRQMYMHNLGHLMYQTLPQLALLLAARDDSGSWFDAEQTYLLLERLGSAGKLSPPAGWNSPLPSIVEAAFGIPRHQQLYEGPEGVYYTAPRASQLLLPAGVNANYAVFGKGLTRHVHSRLALRRRLVIPSVTPLAASPPSTATSATSSCPAEASLVIYLQRTKAVGGPSANRVITNEREMLVGITSWLRRPYELLVLNPSSNTVNKSWVAMRSLLCRAKVVLGPHGGAWGNVFFADLTSDDTHLIEVNYLRGRSCYNKMHHVVGGSSRYWTLEPSASRTRAMLTRPSRNEQTAWQLYNIGMHVNLDDLRTILWHTGVATCGNESAWYRDPVLGKDESRLYRCRAT